MALFWEFFIFELKFRLKSLSTYVYFLLWFTFSFLCVASENFGFIAFSNGKVMLNGPFANSYNDVTVSFFGIIVIAAIFGTSILRDFQRDTYQLLFTKPISKFSYLGGRWAGSFVTTVAVFSGMLFGTLLGTFAPWADHTRIAAAPLSWYLRPFFTILVVQIFFFGSLFFAVAAMTRKIFVVYLQGVGLFMLYLIGVVIFSATRSLEHFWSTILDPIGFLSFSNITKYWTVAEKNTQLIPLTGPFLYNRLLWTGVGALSLAIVWAIFPMSVEALTARSQGRRAARARENEEAEVAAPRRSLVSARLPFVQPVFNAGTSWTQFLSLSRLRISGILHEVPFWGIVVLTMGLALTNGYFAGHLSEANVWPVTYLMLGAVEGNSALFSYIVVALYAAELVWRERDTHFDGIHDALPLRETPDWLSKLVSLAFISLVILTVAMLCGILMQTILGYHHYELTEYFKELYLVVFPQVMMFALLALFIQTIVSNKFVGHAIVIGVFAITPILFNFGFENSLYLYGTTPPYVYSDMNGYGHFIPALFWSSLYWLAIAGFLGVLSIALTRRGAETSWPTRWQLARARLPRLAPAAVLFVLIAIGSGAWYYYNAHVLNHFLTAKERRHRQAEYERHFKKYENLDQPKVTAVDAAINIYPERRSFDGEVRYTLQNKTTAPLQEIHLTDQHESVSNVRFDRPFTLVSRAPRDSYSIYRLQQPLAPGDIVTMTASVGHQSHGFRDGGELPEFAANGTFFDQDYIPHIGYDRNIELDDPRRRREEHLPALEEMAPRGDPRHARLNLFSSQADWITYHTTVSTSPDQIAISPGYLQKEWTANNRRYFEYSMGATHIQDFASWISARYAVKRETYKGVNIEVYYDPKHPYNIDDMIASSRAGLDYDGGNYSPYQFAQYRILEFPRYRTFAQSFPNTVPFSEGIGFIGRVRNNDDIDFTYFVTAHELGHQWWGHQLIGGDVQGSNMMSEALAEYTALRIMAHRYGESNMRRFLKTELDGYLRGRSGEVRHEPPLALVQREPYVWYQKGSVILYALSDYIGEDKLNAALGAFLRQYRYSNANNQVDAAGHSKTVNEGPYPDTRQLVAALRTQTPPDLQYFITDSFDTITLYDNKTLSATSQRQPDGKYKVTLTIQAAKLHADGNGVETPAPMNDFIDIGVLQGKKDHEKVLSLKKERLTSGQQTFNITVNQAPTRAGIDPYNKLIDRNSEDNVMDVTTH